MFNKKNQLGMTLIEMMLALSLSIFLISVVLKMYLIAESSQIAQTDLLTIQQNMQMISQILKHEVKASSYFGCAKFTDDFPFKNNSIYILNQKNRIEKYQNTDVKAGTDAIRFWHASARSAFLVKTMRGYSDLYVSASLPIKSGDNLIISDCQTAEIFQVKQVLVIDNNTKKIVSKNPLSQFYKIHSEINLLEVVVYFIGANNALFTKDVRGNKSELVEGISQMKITIYQIENNKLTAHSVGDLTNSGEIKGISFDLDLLHKKWYVYAAL